MSSVPAITTVFVSDVVNDTYLARRTDRHSKYGTVDNSGKLFSTFIKCFKLKNDAHLARFLDMRPPTISKVRNGVANVSAEMIINIYHTTGFSIEAIEDLVAGHDDSMCVREAVNTVAAIAA